MMLRTVRLCACLSILSVPAGAQIRASERATLSQVIDGTVISFDYARPRVRGRAQIFGGKAVRWNEVWTPGANWATTLETSRPISLEGHAVPKGKYSVWFVVRQSGAWTMVLDPKDHLFHMEPPDSSASQIRFPVTAVASPATEVLTWSFPELRVNGGTLAFKWADKAVSMDLKVTPSFSIAMTPEEAAPLVGRWSFAWVADSGEKVDTVEMVLTYSKGSLYAEYIPEDPYMLKFVLIRLADGSFIPGLFDKGEIYEVIREEIFEFKGPRGRPDAYEVRDDHDELIASGRRLP